ncbi:hypothetical protein OXX79_014158 [Metschnikowia pulcherrima]
MGYESSPRQTTAEFLTAVTDPNGRAPFKGMENQVPKTAQEFSDYWKRSPEYRRLQHEIKEYQQQYNAEQTKDSLLASIEQKTMDLNHLARNTPRAFSSSSNIIYGDLFRSFLAVARAR